MIIAHAPPIVTTADTLIVPDYLTPTLALYQVWATGLSVFLMFKALAPGT